MRSPAEQGIVDRLQAASDDEDSTIAVRGALSAWFMAKLVDLVLHLRDRADDQEGREVGLRSRLRDLEAEALAVQARLTALEGP